MTRIIPGEEGLAPYQPKAGMGSICTLCIHRTSPDDAHGQCCAVSTSSAEESGPAAKLTRFITYRENCTHFALRHAAT